MRNQWLARKRANAKREKEIVAKVSYYVFDKNRAMTAQPSKKKLYRMRGDDLRSPERKPIQRPIVIDSGVRTTRTAKRVKRAYDSSSSSDDYAALGKKLTAKYKVDKIPRSGGKFNDELTDYEVLKKKMEQRAQLGNHKSFNSFYNSYASMKKMEDAQRDTSGGHTTATEQVKKRNLAVKSFKSEEKLGNKSKRSSFAY